MPIDANAYLQGSTVTVKGNTGALARTDFVFSGWSTVAAGAGTSYAASDTIKIGAANDTLYAKWTPGYAVTYSGNGNTGGSVPVDAARYAQGASVTVPGNTGNLAKANATFAGWKVNGSGTALAAGGSFQMGTANVTMYAAWTFVSPKMPISVSFPPADTNLHTVEWSWRSGGGSGAGMFLRRLTNGTSVNLSDSSTSLTYSYPVSVEASYTLYVKERNADGTWGPELVFTPARVDWTAPPAPIFVNACVFNGAGFVNFHLEWQIDRTTPDIYAASPIFIISTSNSTTGLSGGIFTDGLKALGYTETSTRVHACVRFYNSGCVWLNVQVRDKAGNVSSSKSYTCYNGDGTACPGGGAIPISLSTSCSACN